MTPLTVLATGTKPPEPVAAGCPQPPPQTLAGQGPPTPPTPNTARLNTEGYQYPSYCIR
jgi:hypothetical protein